MNIKNTSNTNSVIENTIFNTIETESEIAFKYEQSTDFFKMLYDNGNKTMEFKTDTTDNIMFFKDDGTIGIGTNNPTACIHMKCNNTSWYQQKLEQEGSGKSGIRFSQGGHNCDLSYSDGGLNFKNWGGDILFVANASGIINFQTTDSNNSRIFIENDGNVGINNTNPEKILDVKSTTSGMLPPRMTTTERDVMTPIAGEMIYNTTLNKHQGYDGTIWNSLY